MIRLINIRYMDHWIVDLPEVEAANDDRSAAIDWKHNQLINWMVDARKIMGQLQFQAHMLRSGHDPYEIADKMDAMAAMLELGMEHTTELFKVTE
jgi:hypothetical protein